MTTPPDDDDLVRLTAQAFGLVDATRRQLLSGYAFAHESQRVKLVSQLRALATHSLLTYALAIHDSHHASTENFITEKAAIDEVASLTKRLWQDRQGHSP